jgi:antitoxin component YwqK of YwqJK toxin-antitoxin module
MKRKNILIEKYLEPSEIKSDGEYTTKCWFNKYGEFHSFFGQPSVITINNLTNEFWEKQWHKNGKLHREGNKPAVIYWNKQGEISHLYFCKNGLFNGDGDLPALFVKYNKTIIKYWYKENVLHRDNNMPAELWYENGQITIKKWYKNGELIKTKFYSPEHLFFLRLLSNLKKGFKTIKNKLF